MWKDFFYYSKSERRAVYVLVILIVLLLVAIVWIPERRGKVYPNTSVNDSTELADFLAGIQIREKEKAMKTFRKPRKDTIRLAAFNPNTADSIELSRLGLPAFVVRNVLKYRAKGGRFRTAESFSRIYGLEKGQFERLKPYIYIPTIAVAEHDTVRIRLPKHENETRAEEVQVAKPFKYPVGTLVDVNVADTTELKKIPGIGTVISRRIVEYRNRLGGFYQTSQLEELDCITPELMKWFKVEGGEIRKLNANKAGLDKLRAHPYINFYQAKVIIEHRRKRGKIKSLSRLSFYEEFTEKDLERLSHYLVFD